MAVRPAFRAGSFYPSSSSSCTRLLDDCLRDSGAPPARGRIVGGIVPHAGWSYSGPTAARTFSSVGEPDPRAFVLFGAVHVPGVPRPALSPHTAWETPLGDVTVDGEIGDLLLDACGEWLEVSEAAHRTEHSIEVQVPFVRRLVPGARIVPVAVPPDPSAVAFGETAGRALAGLGDRVVVLGSTDLTHYGPAFYGFAPKGAGPEAHRWSKEVNDRSFLDRVLALDAPGALEDARRHRNACGAGAAAAAIAASRELGATEATLLGHTTSFEVRSDGGEPRDFVGYAAVSFVSP